MSKLNSKLGKVSSIAFTALKTVTTGSGSSSSSKKQRIFFNTINTGNSDKFSVDVGFKQPQSRKDPYQIQYRSHSRYTPTNAKKKGAEWTKWSGWKNLIAIAGVQKNSLTNPDTWNKSNLGVNKNSSYLVCLNIRNYSIGSDYDARSYQFRVRTFNKSTNKHGAWVYSAFLYVYKTPRVWDPIFYSNDSGGLIFKCNIRYGDRGGVFQFASIRDTKGRNLLKNDKTVTLKLTKDTTRTSSSEPPLRTGLVPASCEIPISKLKRAISSGEKLWLSRASVFVGNSSSGKGPLTANYGPISTPSNPGTRKQGGVEFKRLTVRSRDIVINTPKLILSSTQTKAFVEARLYKTDANDTIESATATLSYEYNGKNYSVKPMYSELKLSQTVTNKYIARWIFAKCPFNTKLAVSAKAANSYGSSASAGKATILEYDFWYIQSESSPNRGAVLQWNVKTEIDATPTYTLELPYGRGKPFVAYGAGTSKQIHIRGDVPTKTSDPLFNGTYASRTAWQNIQNNPGIYIVRGPNKAMYRMAILEVSLSDSADSEILSVDIRGAEIE